MSETEFARAERVTRELWRMEKKVVDLEKLVEWQFAEITKLGELLGRAKALIQMSVGGNPTWEKWSKVREKWLADLAKGPGVENE